MPMGTNQAPREPTKALGSQIIKGPGSQERLFTQGANLRHFCPVWTQILDYALGEDNFCIFALGAETAFYWCLYVYNVTICSI